MSAIRIVIAASVTALALGAAPNGFAETGASGEEEHAWTGSHAVRPGADPRWRVQGFTGFEYQGETDLDDDVGDFDYWMVSLGANASRGLGDRMRVALKADYRVVDYRFDLANGIDPWDTVHVFRLNPVLSLQLDSSWSLLGGPIVELSGEQGATFGDSVRGGGMAGVGWSAPSKRLFVALGVIALTELEDDVRLQPLLIVDWKIVKGLALGIQGDTSRGAELRLSWTLDRLTAALGMGFRRERFRLDDDGPVVRDEGIGEEEATTARLLLAYRLCDWLSIEGYGGVSVDGNFRLEDEDGDKIVARDYDASGFGGVNLRLRF